MGAGSAKGVKINDEDFDQENDDRFSVISHNSGDVDLNPGAAETKDNNNQADKKSKVRMKIEALYDESDEENNDAPSSKTASTEKEDEKKRSLFGFARRKEEEDKTNVFVHEAEGDAAKKNGKKETTSRGFKLFRFRKEAHKSEEKDEPLDQEIKDLQRTFDSLGIVGKSYWDDNGPQKGDGKGGQKSQSADDIRDLEPMRNRMNQRRRFSRPANMMTAGGPGFRRGGDGLQTSSGGSKRTFKYSWEVNNHPSSPARSEEWKYEAVVIEGFDIDKFKKANFENSLINKDLSNHIPNSVISDGSPTSSSLKSGRRSPLVYDATEQKLLASIERDFMNY